MTILAAKHVHFVGIGGIGMSALATILAERGITVSGCDADLHQKSIDHLKKLGCAIHEGNGSAGCFAPDIDLFVCSTAVRRDMPEIKAALERGVQVISRAELLSELMREKRSIAVAGSHGKTTTSALISHILIEAKKDPTIIVGGHMGNLGHNARAGNGDLLVAEADESDRSFTLLHPSIAIVTNIDLEHLDTYHDLADLQATFCQFVNRLPAAGTLVLCLDDPGAAAILPTISKTFTGLIITYGASSNATVRLIDYQLMPAASSATIQLQNGEIVHITVPIPGKHHILNATAACAVATALGIKPTEIARAISSFLGVDQRFSYRGTFQGAEIFDDYGHHPTEIANMLAVAKKRAHKRLLVVFQPHRFSRTQKLWDDFVQIFSGHECDLLIITDIYPASETPIDGITGEKLAAAVGATYVPIDENYMQIKRTISEHARPGDLLLFLGAGKINRLSEKLANRGA